MDMYTLVRLLSLSSPCRLSNKRHGQTDVKPDNILVNYSVDNSSESRFRGVALGDCGDVHRVDLNADPRDMFKEDGQIIGAAIFRSPEAMLNLRWGTATDIWSLGTTVSFCLRLHFSPICQCKLTLLHSL